MFVDPCIIEQLAKKIQQDATFINILISYLYEAIRQQIGLEETIIK
jgi:hypothetical protein